jgi:hypothetical protein
MALLPLKLNEFELVYFRPFSYVLSRLSHEQRNAIISVSFSLHSDTTDGILKSQGKAWNHAIRPDKRKGSFDHSIVFSLENLAGLKRMVVEVKDMNQEKWCFEYHRAFVKGLIKQWSGPDGLDIIFRQRLGNQ